MSAAWETFHQEIEEYGNFDDDDGLGEDELGMRLWAHENLKKDLQGLRGDPAKARIRQAVLKCLEGLRPKLFAYCDAMFGPDVTEEEQQAPSEQTKRTRAALLRGLGFVEENVEECW